MPTAEEVLRILNDARSAGEAAKKLLRLEASAPANDAAPDSVAEEEPEEPEKLVLPRGTKPPEDVPDHNVTDESLPRFLLCDGDVHHPIQDPHVEAAKLAFARDLKPATWVSIGDTYDCWLISRHDKEPDRLFDGPARLQQEFDSAQPYWREVCSISERVHYILGNHENRLQRLVGANPGLFGLRALEWGSIAGLPDKVQVHRYGARLRIGTMTFVHGDRLGGKFGVVHLAHWMLANHGNRNVVFGHHHRQEMKCRTVFDEHGQPHDYVAIAQGHGSLVSEQKYVSEPNWQHGFTVIEFWTEAGRPRFTAHPIYVVGGKFSFNGRIYDGRKLM